MNQQNKVYVIDHSTKLGHQAIFVVNLEKIVKVSINEKDYFNGYKIVTKEKNTYYADDDSTFFTLEDAKNALKKIAEKMSIYSNSDNLEILDADKENKILDLST